MDTPRIDEIARRLLESVPPGVRAIQKDLESNFRAVLRASLTKLDLVSRDEFDAQMRVLERTRARLEELERRVAGMEGGGAGAREATGEAAGGGAASGGAGASGEAAASGDAATGRAGGSGGEVGGGGTAGPSGTA
jgi:ubiquinone biosynthesis accessory factor UbiK